MRYEVRNLGGKLLGKLTTVLPPGGVLRLYHLPGTQSYLAASNSPTAFKAEEIELAVDHSVYFRGAPVPTLVLNKGKRTWLNGVMGFSRV